MREYHIDGLDLPSVTTILKATMPDEERMMIDRFYATKPKAHMINIESQRRGNGVDSWCKAYLLGRSLPLVDHIFSAYCRQAEPVLNELKVSADSILVDVIVHTPFYAGTLDAVLINKGVAMVLDVKTRKFLFKPALDKALIQAIAYKEALQRQGFDVRAIAVLTVTEKQANYVQVDDFGELAALSVLWARRLASYLGWSDASL